MSALDDIIGTLKSLVTEHKLDVEVAADTLIKLLDSLGWDLEDMMDIIPTDCSEYEAEEFKLAVRILS